ncbi:site-specific integrase [Paenibacillus jamilae]|uniref:site-specific integrase n=1 Tax=Paenibacillus jamilae TaxID=114136 RepID=UPI003D29C8D0
MMKGIIKTEKGNYRATFDHGTINGHRNRHYKTYKTLEEAEKALTEFNYNKQRNLLVTPNRMTLVEFIKHWMENYVKYNCEETTKYGYTNIINKHIVPYFKELELQKLQSFHIQQYYKFLMDVKGLSPNTVIKHHACLRKCLKFGSVHQFVHRNVADAVELPKKKNFEAKYYTIKQLKVLFEKVRDQKLEVAVYLAGYLGLRREEVIGLKWKNIDLDDRIISIVEVRTSAGKQEIIKQPKTEESKRRLFIPDELLEVLIRHKEKQKYYKSILKNEYVDLDYVYTKDNGELYRVNTVTEQFKMFLEKNDLPPLRFHDLRHSVASILYDQKVDIKAISELLGHSDIATTEKIYTHRFDKTHKKTVNAMSIALNA